jgi:hypothetical protein
MTESMTNSDYEGSQAERAAITIYYKNKHIEKTKNAQEQDVFVELMGERQDAID